MTGVGDAPRSLEELLRSQGKRSTALERSRPTGLIATLRRVLHSGIFRGTTSDRETAYGIPATDAERAALANRQVIFFNTDRGWEESFYAAAGTPGLAVPGLIAEAAPAGWYPTGGTGAPYAIMYGAGQQITAGTSYTAWLDWGVEADGGTVSYRSHDVFTREIDNAVLRTHLPGRYRGTVFMNYQNGTGTAVGRFSSLSLPNRVIEHPIPLMQNYGTTQTHQLELVMPDGGYIYYRLVSGSLNIGSGAAYLKLEYTGPALETA